MQGLTLNLEFEIDTTTHHQDLVSRFTERLNPLAVAAGFKSKPYAFYAKKLQNLTYTEREQLYYDCEKAKNFSAFFYWKLKSNIK